MDTHNLECSCDQLNTLEFFLQTTIDQLKRYNIDIDTQLDNASDDNAYRILLDTSIGFHQKIQHLQELLYQVRHLIHGDSYGNQ